MARVIITDWQSYCLEEHKRLHRLIVGLLELQDHLLRRRHDRARHRFVPLRFCVSVQTAPERGREAVPGWPENRGSRPHVLEVIHGDLD